MGATATHTQPVRQQRLGQRASKGVRVIHSKGRLGGLGPFVVLVSKLNLAIGVLVLNHLTWW